MLHLIETIGTDGSSKTSLPTASGIATRTRIDRFVRWIFTISVNIFVEALGMVVFPSGYRVMRLYNTDTR